MLLSSSTDGDLPPSRAIKNVPRVDGETRRPTALLAGRFELQTRLGVGGFGHIYKGFDRITQTHVAIKIAKESSPIKRTEPDDDAVTNLTKSRSRSTKNHPHSEARQLATEIKIYKLLQDTYVARNVKWPHLIGFRTKTLIGGGSTLQPQPKKFLVMNLLGPNLSQIKSMTYTHKLSPAAVAYLAIHMLTLVEKFHAVGYVHRDLKPQNFVIEYTETEYPLFPHVFLIDYGIAKAYLSLEKKHVPYRQHQPLRGTILYTSIHTHLGVQPSRRDDLASLVYIFVYLVQGTLPWESTLKETNKNNDKKRRYDLVKIMKCKTSVETLVKGVPEPLQSCLFSFATAVMTLGYSETPDYNTYRRFFRHVAKTFTGNLFTS